MALEAKCKLIIAKKEAVFSFINNLYSSAKRITQSEVETRKNQEFLAASSNIENLYKNFNELCDQHNTLLLEANPECELNFSNWSAFETLFSFIQNTRTNLLEIRSSKSVDDNRTATELHYCRLPPLDLVGFSGQQESWPLFYQSFKTNVHDNKKLTDAQRVQYLVGKLSGSALNIFAGILPNESNYATIWDSLVQKYQDKRLLGSMYLNNILDLKTTSDSPAQLNNFIERFNSSMSALKQLEISDLNDFIFTHLALKKLDSQLVQSFELSVRDKDLPSSCDLVNFVRHHIKIAERTNAIRQHTYTAQGSSSQPRPRNVTQKVSHAFAVAESSKSTCAFCKTTHHIHLYECTAFKKLPVNERFKYIKDNKLCINCFSAKHNTLNCGSHNTCKQCHKKHHSLLHFENYDPDSSKSQFVGFRDNSSVGVNAATSGRGDTAGRSVDSHSSVCMHSGTHLHTASASRVSNAAVDTLTSPSHNISSPLDNNIVLPTAQVLVPNNGKSTLIRCLVDSASQHNIITLACCNKLNLDIQPLVNSSLKSVGSISSPIKGHVTLEIESRVSDAHYNLNLLVVNHITDLLPTRTVPASVMEYFKELPLADETWNIPGDISVILGTQMFAFIMLGGKVIPPAPPLARSDFSDTARAAPYALETTLGYIVMGEVPIANPEGVVWSFGPLVNELNKNLVKFWELEELPSSTIENPESQDCEQLFTSTVTRGPCGRYTVSLPFKGDPNLLGESFTHAQRRLTALERKFKAHTALRQAYNDVITDYMKKGYLSEIPYSSAAIAEGYFIPHHAVIRPDKSSTKVRIVLNASAPTDTKLSLNELLHTGPNLQADLFALLLKFRYFKVAITADVQQMYLRILLSESDRKYQKILYRFNDTEPTRILQFNSVAFGLRSSPFLAMRTVRQLADDEGGRFPLAAKVAAHEFYMDDLTTSVPSVKEGSQLVDELIALFKAGGFDLIKWVSNVPELLAHLPESHRASIEFTDDRDTLKVLGLKWIPTSDTFSFTTSTTSTINTKRSILSTIARLFDVLGLVAPVILYAKLLLQELWLAKTGWDQEPPAGIIQRFIEFKNELPLLSELQIPRHLGIAAGCEVLLVAFGDASMKAFGSVVYLHVTHPNRDISIHLVCAKSKVAPLKTITLARLELCAALLLARLVKQVRAALHDRYAINNTFAFSDSTIALSWIYGSPHRWQVFVANRVAKIQEILSPDRFFHVNGVQNPSDCISRGLLPSQLLSHPLWWRGPAWMRHPIAEWPITPFKPSLVEGAIPEAKASVTLAVITEVDASPLLELATRVSTWKRLLRIVVYVLRFAKKLPRLPSAIEASEMEAAETILLRDLQRKYFTDELRTIPKGSPPAPSLRKLDPFVDASSGLLRVGGRLKSADIPYQSRHPVLLPRRDHVVNLIIDDCHRCNFHTGSHLLMSLLRQRYWIISARNIIRQRIRQCNFCFKVAPCHPTPMMANLPPARVQEAKAFTHTGVDYAGPINITLTRRRGVRSQKAYICLFVCLTTKAIHIEIASDLSAETFLDALKRFLARRGPISFLYSDNGTNFIAAKRHLEELHNFLAAKDTCTAFRNELNNRKITWRNIPARAPHFGGIWESQIKSVKAHLFRAIGTQLLCYEELLTVLTQIECLLNSRPLCLLSDQPHAILTPAHFLNTTPLQSLPALEINESMSLGNRKKLLDHMVQSYWKRWHVEYLHTLQLRQKWNSPAASIQPGTLVLISQDNTPPLRWPTGTIEQVYPGKDGVTRVALVRTTAGTFKRPVVKLCPLPSQ